MPAKLSKGDKQLQTVVHIQDGAPVDLLLGTDVLPSLGFCLQEPKIGGPPHNLLGSGGVGEKQDLDGDCVKGPVSTQLDTTHDYTITDVQIALLVLELSAFCTLPECHHHAKLAMANLEGKNQHFLLEPVDSLLADKGI